MSETSTPVIWSGVYPQMPIAVTSPFVTLTFSLSRSSEVKPIKPTKISARSYNLQDVRYQSFSPADIGG